MLLELPFATKNWIRQKITLPGGGVVPGAVAKVPLAHGVGGVAELLEGLRKELVLQAEASRHAGGQALVLASHPVSQTVFSF